MDPEDDVRAFLTGAAGGSQPPMRLEAADVIERGGRVRRRRKRFAVAGTSAATAVVLAVAGFLAGHRAGPPEPVQPAGPGLSTVGTTSPAPTPTELPVPATSIAPVSPSAEPGQTRPRSPRTSVPQAPSAGPRENSRSSLPAPTSTAVTRPGAPTATTR
ncbi:MULTISPECIES: hypothetical protein [Amycolatopsis]|uniref:Uncharacterized protein n=1 Tax=Amycolatopsis bullii TaxID=941987 RepID=A0ABQ3KEK5_9PSEU|nr:hypothetical protein [Amycolatopsis bullii]GHG18593.1 hypothetical protein GCM10017567_41220 [Amycolatopsis bullii]